MRPVLIIGCGLVAITVLGICVGKAIDTHRNDPEGQAAEDAAQAQWLAELRRDALAAAAFERAATGEVAMPCTACGEWFTASRLYSQDRVCSECLWKAPDGSLRDEPADGAR